MSDVPRETPATPAVAAALFEDRTPLAEQYVASLADDAVVRGLIGPREVPRLWERHVLNSAVVADAIEEGCTVADIGSGAGLPGLVLAIRRPDLVLTLVEPLLRRATYLEQVTAQLGLGNVTVVRARAEELHGTSYFDVVTARAVAPMERLAGWALPLLAPDGVLLALKGRTAEDELAAASTQLRGMTVAVEQYGAGWGLEPTRVVRVRPRATG